MAAQQDDSEFQDLEVTVGDGGMKVIIKECSLGTSEGTGIENLNDTAREMPLDCKSLPAEDNLTKYNSMDSHEGRLVGDGHRSTSVEGKAPAADSDKSIALDVGTALADSSHYEIHGEEPTEKTDLAENQILNLEVTGSSSPGENQSSNADKAKIYTVLYSCSKCNFCTNKLSELKTHAQTEQHNNCTTKKDVPESEMNGDNTDTENDTGKQYACSSCSFKTIRFHTYREHLLTHAKIGAKEMFKCMDCDYSTRHKYNLKTHLKRHAKIGELCEDELFRCSKCDYVSPYKHDLMTHVKKHDPQKPFQCDQCDFKSIYKHSLIHHVRSKHEKKRPHKCSECDYSSARKQDLQTHMGRHADEKKFKCDRCNYATPYRVSFKAHMDRHMGNKLFKCDQEGCTFATTTKQNLKSHELRHSTVKPLKCKFCDYTASYKQQMLSHEQKHGLTDPPSKNFQCPCCEYETAHRYSLQRHMNRHQSDRTMPKKDYLCDECGYSTGYKSSLKRHMAKHSDVKPFKCGHCDYSAINMTQMHVHIAKHTGIKPFKCNICEYATANKQHLVGHMAKHSAVRLNCPKCNFSTAWKQRLRVHLKAHESGSLFQKKDQSSATIQTNKILYVTSKPGDVEDALTAESEAALSEISSAIEAFHSYSLQGEVEVTSTPTVQDQENSVIPASCTGRGEDGLFNRMDDGTDSATHTEAIHLIDEDGNQTMTVLQCVNGESSGVLVNDGSTSNSCSTDGQKNTKVLETTGEVADGQGLCAPVASSKSSGESEGENSELVIDEMKTV